MELKLTKNQQQCFDQIENSHHNFAVLGKPGVGKSVLINALVQHGKKSYTLAAPTGLAALNIGGRTLHSIFRIPVSEGIIEPAYDMYTQNERAYSYIKYQIRTLIVDEISMVAADKLDYIDRCLRAIKGNNNPFGGIQIIVVGDFFQLPPVTKALDTKQFKEHGYESQFAFSAKIFKDTFKILMLDEVLRQKGDPQFINLLNNARTGNVTSKDILRLNKNVGHPGDIRIYLTCTNAEADKVNQDKLAQIQEPAITFSSTEFGEWPAYPVEKELRLKVGAQVMVKKNGADRPPKHREEWDSKVVNGSLGKIVAINKSTMITSNTTVDDPEYKESIAEVRNVDIMLEDGKLVKIHSQRWERTVRTRTEDAEGKARWEEVVVASFNQIPLQLAWAISIHKSQGQTFEKAHINANKVFAAGQLYVALSRVKTLAGISLEVPVTMNRFWADRNVLRFFNALEEQEYV
jgi:ATP-dependent DNA helicase PIF1